MFEAIKKLFGSGSADDNRAHSNNSSEDVSPEAAARKRRSLEILKAEGVPFIAHLPVIETEPESHRRAVDEVSVRAMALMVVAANGEGAPPEMPKQITEAFSLSDAFTPEEKTFLDDPSPSQDLCNQYSFRYEANWALMWSLGFIESLDRPDHMCDVAVTIPIMQTNGREGMIAKAALRPQHEILDATDLIYRYHWAVRDAFIHGSEIPTDLHPGVVQQRHHALNWLISNLRWDDVDTPT